MFCETFKCRNFILYKATIVIIIIKIFKQFAYVYNMIFSVYNINYIN